MPGRSRRRRHHLQPRDQPGAVGVERAGRALDRQHHQGDDRARVPRVGHAARRRRSPCSAPTSIARRRPICAPAIRSRRRSAQPAAHRIGQRRGARAGARVALRLRGLHRSDERKGRRARSRRTTHYADPSGLLATNVSSAYDMARLIAFAASDDRIGSIMRKATYTVGSRQAHDQRIEHESPGAQRRDRRARRQDRIHQPLRLLPGDAAAPAADRPAGRGRRPRRAVEPGPLLGDAPPVQLDDHAHADACSAIAEQPQQQQH